MMAVVRSLRWRRKGALAADERRELSSFHAPIALRKA
jgi:hypothetical protein